MAHGCPKLFGGPEKAPPEPAAKVLGPNFEEAVQGGGPESFAQTLAKMGAPEPQVAAVQAGLAEFGGGLGLVTGFMTRPAGLSAAANMAVAARKAHWPQGFYGQGGCEFPMLLGLVAGRWPSLGRAPSRSITWWAATDGAMATAPARSRGRLGMVWASRALGFWVSRLRMRTRLTSHA